MEHPKLKMKNSIEVLVLDFDGVICDSRNECLDLSLNCFLDMEPSYTFASTENSLAQANDYFLECRGLVRPARNFYLLWILAFQHPAPSCSVVELELMAPEYEAKLKEFERLFFNRRKNMLRNDPEGFIALNAFYSDVQETLDKLTLPTYIVSTKDADSIKLLLKSNNIKVENVFGFGPKSKVENIETIIAKHSVAPQAVAFVDDNPLHLDDVAKAGVRTLWASWGYGPQDFGEHRYLEQFAEIVGVIEL
jgi:phosphoglycolate phosphatase-like HAD superfamily hydrolase